MTGSVEHLFMYLFAICISSLVWYMFKHFAHFHIGLFVFSLLFFKVLYVCNVVTSSLGGKCFANIFSQSVTFFSFS